MRADPGLSIREIAKRSGVAAATLRMWEQRHGFPLPDRLPSGHRRYSEEDVEAVRAVEAERRAGVSLSSAIQRARQRAAQPESSIFAGLRRRRPELDPFLLPKRTLIGMSEAIEDECAVRTDRSLLLASFQHERHYRAVEDRWRNLAAQAEVAMVFADFPTLREPEDGPVEVPIERSDPMMREWSLICKATDYSACLCGWEPPGQDSVADLERRFETVWSVEAAVVGDALRVAVSVAARHAPAAAEVIGERLEPPERAPGDELRVATALTGRMVAYVSARSSGAATSSPHGAGRPPTASRGGRRS